MLSAVSQQIQTIQESLKELASSIKDSKSRSIWSSVNCFNNSVELKIGQIELIERSIIKTNYWNEIEIFFLILRINNKTLT